MTYYPEKRSSRENIPGSSRKKVEKKRVRKQIFISGGILTALFVSMLVYMVAYTAGNDRKLLENEYNGRESAMLSKNLRGKIFSADGEVLAQSKAGDDGKQVREYPQGKLFSHVIGYTAKGGSGVEKLENYQLIHSDLTLPEKAAYDDRNELYPGNDIYTSLDVKLQKACLNALGNHNGAVIVSEAETGRILAMVSNPDFDPEKVNADWDKYVGSIGDGAMVNRVSQGLYAPGSTFKIFDAIEFMDEDMNKAMAYTFDCPGYTTIDGEMINCYHWEVHGKVDLKASFAESCNSSFATIGTSLNRDAFKKTLDNMMFGEKLPYDMESAVSSFVLDDSTSTKEVMQLSIGQGQTLMSPLHLNMITQAIANGGVVHKATVVDKVTSASGTVLSQTKPEDYRTVMSSEVAQKMQEFMREVVVNGTATKLSTRPYNAAGKTGTAEFSTNTSDSNVWFTGYAYDDSHPKVAVTIIMEKTAGSGGAYAVPAVRDILDTYFGYTPEPGEDDDANYVHVINDHNGDGVPDNAGAAASNADEGSSKDTAALNIDTNGDGIMDAIDLNGDGVPDAVDTNGDGIPDTNVGGGATNTSGQNAATAAGAAGTTGAQDNGQTGTEMQTNTQNSTAAGAGTQQDTAGVQTTVQQNTTATQNAGQQNTTGSQQTTGQNAAGTQNGTLTATQGTAGAQTGAEAQTGTQTGAAGAGTQQNTAGAQGEAAWSEADMQAAEAAAGQ